MSTLNEQQIAIILLRRLYVRQTKGMQTNFQTLVSETHSAVSTSGEVASVTAVLRAAQGDFVRPWLDQELFFNNIVYVRPENMEDLKSLIKHNETQLFRSVLKSIRRIFKFRQQLQH